MEQMSSVGQDQASLETSLQTAVKGFTDAFNRLDPREIASFWADEGTVLNPFGNYGKGRSEVERVLREDAARFLQGAKLTGTIVGARRIADDCVLLDVDQKVENYQASDGSRGPVDMHIALLARKNGDRWQWLDVRAYMFRQRPEPLH